MTLEVLYGTYGEREDAQLHIVDGVGRTSIHPDAMRKVLDILDAFPSQSLAYQRAARADVERGEFIFAHSDPTHGSWKPFLTLSFAEAFRMPPEELRRNVDEEAVK